MEILTELKEQTSELHTKAEEHPLMQGFRNSVYDKKHLLQYFVNLRPVYETVEQRFLIPYIHKNFDLCRSRLVSKDIAVLYKEERVAGDFDIKIFKLKECTTKWVTSQWEQSSDLLVSDLYVRWLADMYGGRVFAKTLAPYNNTFVFKDAALAIQDVKEAIKEHSSIAYNMGVDSFYNYNWKDVDVKQKIIIHRAKEFFQYHIDLFDAIYNE
jgi:heme oxygenase